MTIVRFQRGDGHFGRPASRALDTRISHLLSFSKSNFASPLGSRAQRVPLSLLFALAFFPLHIPFFLRPRELCLTFSVALARTRILLLSCHACTSVIASLPKSEWTVFSSSRGIFSQDFLFFPLVLASLATKRLLSSATRHVKLHRLHSAEWKSIGLVRRSYVTPSKIAEYSKLTESSCSFMTAWKYIFRDNNFPRELACTCAF